MFRDKIEMKCNDNCILEWLSFDTTGSFELWTLTFFQLLELRMMVCSSLSRVPLIPHFYTVRGHQISKPNYSQLGNLLVNKMIIYT